MGERDENSLDERMGRIEGDLDEIRIALWQISKKLESLKPEVSRPEAAQPAKPVLPQLPDTPAPPRITSSPERREAKRARRTQPQPAESQVSAAAPIQPAMNPVRQPMPVPSLDGSTTAGSGAPPSFRLPKVVYSSKFWFNIIGIALVLLGVVFLYKYSVDQGWINSQMKVAFGMAIGAILLILGLFLHGRQRLFSQMMVGAGIAVFYITGYAAYQVYELIPRYEIAVAWMSAVTLAAFVLSVQQNEQVQALVATIGGLATPFLMHQGVTSKWSMVLYACLVLTGSVAVHFYKGWRPLLWVSVIGGWLTLLFIYVIDVAGYHGLTRGDKMGLQAGVIFAVLSFWVAPVVRELLSARNPVSWPRPPVVSAKARFADFEGAMNRHVHALSISTPFLALFFTRNIWHLTNKEWGWITLGASALLGLAFLALYSQEELKRLAYTQALVDLALLTMALGLILDGDARFIAITAEATALQFAAWKLKDRLMLAIAHSYYVFLGVWLFEKMIVESASGTAVLNAQALSELFFIVAVAAVSFLLEHRTLRYVYQLAAYGALLAIFLREFSDLTNGQAYVTVSWGICAVALLTAGIIWADNNWRLVALITLFTVVGKLILVDLASVKAIWRVLLFIGFGALFLVLSYFFQSLWKPPARPGDSATDRKTSPDQTSGGPMPGGQAPA